MSLVSTLDGLLPFLAGRHSVFPHFDLQWSLVTEEDVREAAVSAGAATRFELAQFVLSSPAVPRSGAESMARLPPSCWRS